MAGWLKVCEEEGVRGEFGEGLRCEGGRGGHRESVGGPNGLCNQVFCVRCCDVLLLCDE